MIKKERVYARDYMKKHETDEALLARITRETQAEMMRGEPLSIKGRDDLMTAVERIEYDVASRVGKLHLAELCTVNYDGCIRLFTDIDSEVQRIEVFSGEKPDGVYKREGRGGWQVLGFPFTDK